MSRFDARDAADLVARARADAGLTQAELARRAEVGQPNLASIESGRRRASAELLERILAAADYRPSIPLHRHVPQIRNYAAERGLGRPQIFGSIIRGEDHFDSDIDVFVDAPAKAGMGPLADLSAEIERLTGFPADVISIRSAATTPLGRELLRHTVAL